VLLGVLLLVAQNSTVTIDSYGLVDARTVAMRVAVAPCSWTRVTSVAETPTEVRVEIQTWPCPIPGPGTASLVARDVVLALRDPLGARTVVNEQGRRVAARAGG
jgi:hypothetical protein